MYSFYVLLKRSNGAFYHMYSVSTVIWLNNQYMYTIFDINTNGWFVTYSVSLFYVQGVLTVYNINLRNRNKVKFKSP